MPRTAVTTGVILILIGLLGYAYGAATGSGSFTALIPAIFGLLIAGLGFGAQKSEKLRKHLMHAAVVIALLGFLAVAGRVVPRLGELALSVAVLAQFAMAIVCLVFVILAVRSFIAARRGA